MSSKASYIYVASSWRNPFFDGLMRILKEAGLDCFNFKRPEEYGGDGGFHWSTIDPQWESWSPRRYRYALDQLYACDRLILVLPADASAHLELGYAIAAGKETFILLSTPFKPELMYRAADHICISTHELLGALGVQD